MLLLIQISLLKKMSSFYSSDGISLYETSRRLLEFDQMVTNTDIQGYQLKFLYRGEGRLHEGGGD